METCTYTKISEQINASPGLVLPEYRVIYENIKAYQLLFRYKYQEGVSNLGRLADLLGLCDIESLSPLLRNLDAYFRRVMGGDVRSDLLDIVCPSCFKLELTNFGHDGDEIKKTCGNCGEEADESVSDIDAFDQSIEMGSTFAPECKLSASKGLGNTLNHKKYLHVLLHDYNVDFNEFKKICPEIAQELLNGVDVVTETHVYHLMDSGTNAVRRVPVNDYFEAKERFWHNFDKPLRKQLAHLSSASYQELKGVLDYAEQLCDSYGLKRNVTSDQVLRNNLGCDIRRLRPQLKAQHKFVPAKRLADTLFYLNLLLFYKTEAAISAKQNLSVDKNLVNYYKKYMKFLHDNEAEDNSSTILDAMEKKLLRSSDKTD